MMPALYYLACIGRDMERYRVATTGYQFSVAGLESAHFFAHRLTGERRWVVSEASTGLGASISFPTRRAAIEGFRGSVLSYGPDRVLKNIKSELERCGPVVDMPLRENTQ